MAGRSHLLWRSNRLSDCLLILEEKDRTSVPSISRKNKSNVGSTRPRRGPTTTKTDIRRTTSMISFSEAKTRYDDGPGKNQTLSRSLVVVDGKFRDDLPIRNSKGEPLEEYYKWQFIY